MLSYKLMKFGYLIKRGFHLKKQNNDSPLFHMNFLIKNKNRTSLKEQFNLN